MAPYPLFCGDYIRKWLADERKTGKVAHIEGRYLVHDVDEKFAG
jgi:hypothetical protein